MILGDNTYYVSSNTTDICPQPCHPLSHYITDTATYFTSNATFIFMEGEHLLDSKGLVQVIINNVDNFTLRGESGHSNTDVIIRCGSNTHGLEFNDGSIINIYGITITGCGQDIVPLTFTNIASLYIHHILLYNNIIYNNSSIPGALYIYSVSDTTHITIANSKITNNTVGLYIYTGTDTHNIITITNSAFNNTVVGGDGGGLLIHIGTNTQNNITIANSVVTGNTVDKGGGLVIYSSLTLASTNTHNNITIINSSFTNNRVGIGGGMCIYLYYHADTYYNIIVIINSAFTNNRVGAGGGMFIYGGTDNITITNSVFANNTVRVGGGLCMFSDLYNIIISTSYFINNTFDELGGGLMVAGTVRCIYSNITIINSTLTNNHGSGILAHYTMVTFTEGHSIVANNSSPTDGGGIFLSEDCYLTTSNGGHVSFINNTAHRYGGAIYSADNDYRVLHYKGHYRALVTMQCTVYDLSATFVNNSAARAGDQLYGGVFTLCKTHYTGNINQYLQYLFQCNRVPDTLKRAPSVHPYSAVSSDPIVVCPCVNGTVDCNTTSLDKEVYPGQILNVSLVTVGLCGGVSPGTVVVVGNNEHINLISSATDYTSTSCTTLNYTVKLITNISNTAIMFNVPDGDIYDIRPISVNLTILPCPLGLVVNFTSGDCVCNNYITHLSGVICNISWMPYPIQRSGNNWIYHRYDDCTIAHIGCPFDYCNTSPAKFALNESDLQCNYNRSGILCGQCIQGLSLMIGSNRCANCTDTKLVSVSIIILAAVAGVVLIILLMLLNLTVSVGSINGLLFYANLVKLNESVFFSSGNIPVVTQFISWCNLDMGLEYCFIDKLDGYVKTWLQFVFPLYVWFLVIVIILGCRYSGRLSRLCGRNAVPVLATLILMSYTKLSRTATNALMINTLQCGEYKWSVWNVDGNIAYLGGKHAVLFTVSLLFLITGLVHTGLVFSSQWLQRYSGKCCKSTRDPVVRLKPLIDAYTGPFQDKYRFWTGLCLIVRLMLTVVFSFTTTLQSKLNNYIILLTVGAMIVFIAVSGRVYKDKHLTVLEIFSYVNIICLCVMTVLFTESYSHVVSINVIVSVSVSIEILLFVIIVTVHCSLAFKKVLPNCKLCCKTCAPSEDELLLIAGDTEEGSPVRVIAHREELIYDFYLNKEHP